MEETEGTDHREQTAGTDCKSRLSEKIVGTDRGTDCKSRLLEKIIGRDRGNRT